MAHSLVVTSAAAWLSLWGFQPLLMLPADRAVLGPVETQAEASAVHKTAKVLVSVALHHSLPAVTQVEVRVRLGAHNFKNPAMVERSYVWSIGPGTTTRTVSLPLDHPQLQWPWDFHETHTFEAQVEVLQGGVLQDRATSVFSFHTVVFDPTVRIWTVNGKRVYPQPAPWRADGGINPNPKALPIPGR